MSGAGNAAASSVAPVPGRAAGTGTPSRRMRLTPELVARVRRSLADPGPMADRSYATDADHDAAIRALLNAYPAARDIEIAGAGLEEAFVELTGDDDNATAADERQEALV